MRWPALILTIILYSGCCFASPNLDSYLDINGVRLYQDHLKKNTYYLTPSQPVLKTGNDNQPDVSFNIYRYLGRKGTSDSGKFRVKGILSIGLETERGKKLIKSIKKKLSGNHKIKYPRFRSMPVAETQGKLIFADSDIQWSQGSRWSGKRLIVSLDSTMAEILWKAVEAGQTLISVEMVQTLKGVKINKDKKWEDSSVPFSATIPVTLDMAACPSHFSKTDLGGRMVKGYTGIDIFCFDFIEQLDENLYSKMVEVAIPTPGKPLVESAEFRHDGDYRTRIQFKLAKDLDIAYKVRITRIFKDGRSETGPWEKRTGESMLDITDYKDENQDVETENESIN